MRTPALWPWTLAALGVLLAWDASGLDLAVARLAGGAHGFPWRDNWIATALMHDGARAVAFAAGAWLLAGLWWPTGVLRRLSWRARAQWAASLLAGLLVISLLKHSSLSSCPWDLVNFGGVASYRTHWAWGRADGGPGHCFPAGHASAAFAFIGGFFVLRPVSGRLAWRYLAAVAAAGLALGVGQQLRGAHFMSHTLWTAWICWVTAWSINALGWAETGRLPAGPRRVHRPGPRARHDAVRWL
jgi:membrane-associated PAP2 superfamily phosphatase